MFRVDGPTVLGARAFSASVVFDPWFGVLVLVCGRAVEGFSETVSDSHVVVVDLVAIDWSTGRQISSSRTGASGVYAPVGPLYARRVVLWRGERGEVVSEVVG